MRSVRHELASMGVVLALPVALALVFPYEAVSFRAEACPPAAARAAFVVLSAAEENAALRAAKTSWQTGASGERRMRVRIPLGSLSEEQGGPILGFGSTTPSPVLPPLRYEVAPWRPSAAANAAAKIEPQPLEKSKPAFSRDELLRLDDPASGPRTF